MFEGHDRAIHDLLKDRQLVGAEQLRLAGEQREAGGKPLARVVLDLNLVARDDLLRAVAGHVGGEFVAEPPATLPGEALAVVDGELARTYGVAPVHAGPGEVSLLVVDPFNPHLVGDLTFALGRDVRVLVADPERVAALIRQHYGEEDASPGEVLGRLDPRSTSATDPSVEDLEAMAGQRPIVRFVHGVLTQAVTERASDVHFEPFENDFRIRCRIDGVLSDLASPPRASAPGVISRIKVLANLNIAERRVPQDGRIRLEVDGRRVDLRVATLPTQFGESVVLRVLDPTGTKLDLGELGMTPEVRAAVERTIRRPAGIFIVTGPTGSGKTTTLHSCLRRLNALETKILTVEDPVEYEIEGVMQVPVNPVAGLSFASALRSFLRHDPDIVMVGEIRDEETAQIAIQAALTGHLVLTTLHTNDAAGAVTRLMEMGIEPFLLASTLEGVVAQRLVRRICPDCREEWFPPPELLARGELPPGPAGRCCFRGRGCGRCHHSGYRGRIGFFEMLTVDDGLRELIGGGAPPGELRAAALLNGMRPLQDDGWRLVREGETTLEELRRYL